MQINALTYLLTYFKDYQLITKLSSIRSAGTSVCHPYYSWVVHGYDSTQSIYRLDCRRIKAHVRCYAVSGVPVYIGNVIVVVWSLNSIVVESFVHPNVIKMVKQIKSMVIECCDSRAVCIWLE